MSKLPQKTLAQELAERDGEADEPDEHPDLDLHPITVGFDLRAAGIAVHVPEDCRSVRYVGPDGATYVATGTRADVVTALVAAGFDVAGSEE